MFQDIPFEIYVLTPINIGRSDIFSYQQNIDIYFCCKGVQDFGKGLKDKLRSFRRHFA
jgi:hypothetical protein